MPIVQKHRREGPYSLLGELPLKLFCLSALVVAACSARQPAPPKPASLPKAERYRPYSISLDGDPIPLRSFYSLEGDPERPHPGDLFSVQRIPIRLGEERVLRLTETRTGSDILIHQLQPDGKKTLMAIRVGFTYDSNTRATTPSAVFTGLSPQELRGLHGVLFTTWSPAIERQLRHLDPHRVCLGFTDGIASDNGGQVPVVPGGHRCLYVEQNADDAVTRFESLAQIQHYKDLWALIVTSDYFGNWGAREDFRHFVASRGLRLLSLHSRHIPIDPEILGTLKDLRWLRIFVRDIASLRFLRLLPRLRYLDLRSTSISKPGIWLSSPELRWLDLSDSAVTDLKGIGHMPNLRWLNLSETFISDVAFVRYMPRLRHLNIAYSTVRSLEPLREHRSITEVNAGASKVSALPPGALPSLARLNLLATPMSPRQVSDFRRANPKCMVELDMIDALRTYVKDANRVAIRMPKFHQDECTRNQRIIDLDGATHVSEILSTMRVEPETERYACGCCFQAHIDFFVGDRLITSVQFAHKPWSNLTWSGWPLRARLTEEGASLLSAYLAKHGYQQPAIAIEKARKEKAHGQHRLAIWQRILPPAVIEGLRASTTEAQAIKAFSVVSGLEDRLRLLLRLTGSIDGSWHSQPPWFNALLREFVREIGGAGFSGLLLGSLTDHALVTGAAWALFRENQYVQVEPRVLSRILRPLAQAGWSHPRASNRHITIAALGRIGTSDAVEALRFYVRERPVPRQLPEIEEVSSDVPEGPQPEHWPPVKNASELAHAAFLLAKLGDRQSEGILRKLAAAASGPDQDLLRQAVMVLRTRLGRTPRRPEP